MPSSKPRSPVSTSDAEPVALVCADKFTLRGHLWRPMGAERGTVVINPATGVLARFYHRYAAFLAENGFSVLTYDYRGIGLSRPARLRGFAAGWRDWGERDVEAAIAFARRRNPDQALAMVGHSIGGVLIGFAASAPVVDRILTVGAQHAYCRDYAAAERRALFLRWHVAMPLATALCGYFPGRRIGWLEDLPAGVARQWAFMRADLAANVPAAERTAIRARFAAVRAPILAISMSDDPFGTEPAICRTLSYFSGCRERWIAMLEPSMLAAASVGHFAPFHSRFRDSLWPKTVEWLGEGNVPWPAATRMPSSDA